MSHLHPVDTQTTLFLKKFKYHGARAVKKRAGWHHTTDQLGGHCAQNSLLMRFDRASSMPCQAHRVTKGNIAQEDMAASSGKCLTRPGHILHAAAPQLHSAAMKAVAIIDWALSGTVSRCSSVLPTSFGSCSTARTVCRLIPTLSPPETPHGYWCFHCLWPGWSPAGNRTGGAGALGQEAVPV